jgi:uncharacterized protein YeaC (DUF1315 family)
MSEQVKVGVDVDVQGLEAAMARFERLTGTAASVRRAIGQIGRGGEAALGASGYVTPETYQRMAQAVETLKRHDGDLTKQVQDRKTAFESILTQYPKLRAEVERLAKFGQGPQAIFSGTTARGSAFAADDKLIGALFGLPEARWRVSKPLLLEPQTFETSRADERSWGMRSQRPGQ